MLNQTTLSGIRIVLYVALRDSPDPIAPPEIAEALDLSKSYCAKITNLLGRAGIFRTRRGAHGGVELRRPRVDITMLEIVEACQGRILSHYCQEVGDLRQVCAFHRAMVELHDSVTGVLSRWTVANLARKPLPSASIRNKEDLVPALEEMISYEGPYVLDVEVPYQEHVLPMIPTGMTVRDIITE